MQALIHSWWVLLFGLICYSGYDLATTKQWMEKERLKGEIARVQRELAHLDHQLLAMDARLESHDDPAFLETRLMARLGLVPKGQTKVVFKR